MLNNRYNSQSHDRKGVVRSVSTIVKNPLQIAPFMQNEPNFKMGKIKVTSVLTRNYKKELTKWHKKNKPKQTQFMP